MGPVAQELKLVHLSHEGFLRLLDFVLQKANPRRVFFGYKGQSPAQPPGQIEMYPRHVFDIPLCGEKHVVFGGGGKVEDMVLCPGEVLYCEPLAWKLPIWDRPHELCCLVFSENLIRLTYVDISSPMQAPGMRPVCTCFYHTQLPPSEGMRDLLHALGRLAAEGDPENAAPDLMRGLVRMTRAQLAADRTPLMTKAQITFQKAQQYLAENFGSPVSRAQVAKAFRLHPGYLSRIFHEQSGMTFSAYLRKLRMENAAFLLRETDLLVDEITDRCGYQSTTFFTTAFRRHHGLPPGRFRCR